MRKERARAKAEQYLVWATANERKAFELRAAFDRDFKDFDWTQPILRGHHSQRRHERVFERRDSMFRKCMEHEEKAKRMREKATNLFHFANTNKGDAEARREQMRATADSIYAVGSRAVDAVYGEGTIMRVNKKTYTVKFSSFTCARDKSYFVKR